jgi:hypothetical protein
MAAMIISLENQNNEMMQPLKNCLKVRNPIPDSLKNQEKDVFLPIKKCIIETEEDIKKLNIIPMQLEDWKQNKEKKLKVIDDKVTEVLKTVNEQVEERVRVKTEKVFENEGLRRSGRIRRRLGNSSSDSNSN